MSDAPAYLTAPVGYRRAQNRPLLVLRALAAQLRARGTRSLYGASCAQFGVLSLPGVSVWTNGRVLWWRAKGEETTWPAADPIGAARRLGELTGGDGGGPAAADGPKTAQGGR